MVKIYKVQFTCQYHHGSSFQTIPPKNEILKRKKAGERRVKCDVVTMRQCWTKSLASYAVNPLNMARKGEENKQKKGVGGSTEGQTEVNS